MLADLKIPPGFYALQLLPDLKLSRERRLFLHRALILVLTYCSYVCYHASRKPMSVVKNELLNCNNQTNCTSWITEMSNVDASEGQRLEGVLDSTYLFAYAFFMFFSGVIAERVNLRFFLSLGMLFSGIFTFLFGLAKYINVHGIAYFVIVQFFGGAFQSTGWPSVVTIVANWFGKGKKGLIFGIWNSHTSVGNILGSFLAGLFVEDNWGLSFIVPGCLISGFGFVIWLMLIIRPEDVGIELPCSIEAASRQNLESNLAGRPRSRHRSSRSANHSEVTALLLSSDESDDEVVTSRNPQPLTDDMFDWVPEVRQEDQADKDATRDASEEPKQRKPISFCAALRIPGVVEFSFCLFFAKLVSYTFLFWLPTFIKQTGLHLTSEDAAYISILFDLGGILGGILAGIATDYTGKSASVCAIMLIGAIPTLFAFNSFGQYCPMDVSDHNSCFWCNMAFLFGLGLLVNGPYALITTAVSAELGTHKSLAGSDKALATVASVIDGTGSIGAAVGPFLAAAIGLNNVFYMLMASDVLALCFLVRLVRSDVIKMIESRRLAIRPESGSATFAQT